jgi:hypothetical protein
VIARQTITVCGAPASLCGLICFVRACARVRACVCVHGAEIANDRDKFVKFVNGILNETNSLITDALSKLHDIREVEVARVCCRNQSTPCADAAALCRRCCRCPLPAATTGVVVVIESEAFAYFSSRSLA